MNRSRRSRSAPGFVYWEAASLAVSFISTNALYLTYVISARKP
jgi:hypothetical protein